MFKQCPSCQQEKDIFDFKENKSYEDGYEFYCKDCLKNKRREYYLKNREKLINSSIETYKRVKKQTQDWMFDYLSAHPCQDCGETDILVLQFDHPDGEKEFSLGDSLGRRSLVNYIKEAEKCDVVCANCHVRRTAKSQGWWRLNA